ncbi:MAG: acyl-CoA dehydrogenase [Euryarchaeota archaeon]|nr:acyl-CoA dehydrogenase [Euryarchaeota archaeon]DAC61096.1 MAG TPA: acyl-CoA dehydrogenase [Candidatus Poseidoniales archaeon]HIH82120.1 acyl-CoA dehydrogenase [Candidatus Thalassarchaeaceae archaeon]|tara:strand:+ start:5554 stop:6702 length:1149 start_codon:yes stop_codon:yes gene_type:complete
MVDFTLSEEQQMLQELAREFATENVRPMAEHWDANSEFPMEAIEAAHELGLMNLHIPEEYGGMGMGTMDEVIVQEEFAWGDPGFATASYSNGLTAAPIITGGTEEQKAKYLGRLAEAPRIAAYAVTEPGAGSDVASIQTTAVKDGDHYILNGSKMWITGAGKADWFFVLAYTDKSAGYKGMSAFIVESGWDGVSLGKKETNMGQRASDTRSVNFEDVRVPVENLVGGVEGKGWFNAMVAFDLSRPNVAAHATGISRAAFEYALQYADERETFGKKLHQHQAIQFMLADMKTKIEASRALTWKSAWEADNGIRNTESAAHAKRFAADMAMEVTTDAVQVFGGYGYSEEYPVARLMRAAKVMQIYEGSSQVQRMIIGREMTRNL